MGKNFNFLHVNVENREVVRRKKTLRHEEN